MKNILIGVGVVVVIGAGVYALVSRNVLKGYFEKGDIPSAQQFSNTIDSNLNIPDDRKMLGLKEHNPTKEYQVGDTAVKLGAIYQAKVVTQNQTEFKLDEAQSVTFRWTPIVPKSKEPVTYRLKVWQLMEGQNGSAAMKSNKPIVTKDVTDISEVTVSSIYTGPCKPPYLCDFVWSVEAISASSTTTGAGGASVPVATQVAEPAQTGRASDGTH
jgi:hypothetical protein